MSSDHHHRCAPYCEKNPRYTHRMEAAVVPFVPSEIDALASPEPDFNTEAQDPGSRVRKRFRRRSSSSVTMDQPQSLLSIPTPRPDSDEPQRDDQYYMCDGSCILRVGNTLFNVRSLHIPSCVDPLSNHFLRYIEASYPETLLHLPLFSPSLRAMPLKKVLPMQGQSSFRETQ